MSAKDEATRRELLGALGVAGGAAIAPGLGRSASAAAAAKPSLSIFRLSGRGDTIEISVPVAGVATVTRRRSARRPVTAAFLPAPEHSPHARLSERAGATRIDADGIAIEFDRLTGLLRFLAPDGRVMVAERDADLPIAGVTVALTQSFETLGEGPLRGLGQFRDPLLDYRDREIFLAQANSDAINPYLVSADGWGLLWDTGTAAYLVSRGRSLSFHSVGGDALCYHVAIGPTFDDLIRCYRALTGAAALLPRWAYGYWQNRERYASQQQLTDVVGEFRRRGLPLDAIVLDWQYWGGEAHFSGMRFDPVAFPQPKRMVDDVHRAGVHILASIWPAVGPDTGVYRDLAQRKLLLAGDHWSPDARVIDVSSPRAQAIYWRHVQQGLVEIGMDGLWTDGNEPEFRATGDRYLTAKSFAAAGRTAYGPAAEQLLTYSWFQARSLDANWRRTVPGKRTVILTRSAYAGQQRFGAITWSGDTFASWGTLANQILAARQISLSGLPWWTCDIGAFSTSHRFPDGLADPAYRELYVRWFQFGAFLPVFRAHGTDIPREPWRFGDAGDPIYEALRQALEERYTLAPYIDSVMAAAALHHDTPLRDLAMDHSGDPAVECPTAFKLGRDLLVVAVDRPFFAAPAAPQELIPNFMVKGENSPAALLEIFRGAEFEERVDARLTDDLKLTWEGYLPSALAGLPFSLRWSGILVPEESGTFEFVVTGKGHVRLSLAGKIWVDDHLGTNKVTEANGAVSFRGHQGDAQQRFSLPLERGRRYPFTIELRQPTPGAVGFWLEWLTPSNRRKMAPDPTGVIDVLLPRGSDWYDWRSKVRYAAGSTVRWPVTLEQLPVFARAGAIIATSPGLDRLDAPFTRLTIHVFAGRTGVFDLYDDNGNGEDYCRGLCRRILVRWDDEARRLTFERQVGRFPGEPTALAVTVLLHDRALSRRAELSYRGEQTTVQF